MSRGHAPADARGTLSGDLDADFDLDLDLPADASPRATLSGDLEDLDDAAPRAGAGAGGSPMGTLSGGDDDSLADDDDGRAPDDPSAPAGVALLGHDLELVEELGRGGMGVVWRARQRSLDRIVAVKTLHASVEGGAAALKFVEEAIISGRLEHPNIPPVHLCGKDAQGRPFLCLKLIHGVSWSRLLEPETDKDRALAERYDRRKHLQILQHVCDALAFAHANGVLHRDLKPENVMVGEFGEVQLMDWGVAIVLEHAKEEAARGKGLRRPVGTPAYMPPELARADVAQNGPWTDVYLLGGVLYELLTGSPPHRGASVMEALLAAQDGTIEHPSARAPDREIPEMLAAIAMRALEPEPSMRYQSARELSEAIATFLRNEASVDIATVALRALARIEERAATSDARPAEIYPALAACEAELAQAVRLWPNNRKAQDGLARAHLVHARFAIVRGDLDLAESELRTVGDGATGADAVRVALADAHRKRAAARYRRRALAALGAVLLLLFAGLAWQQYKRFERRSSAIAAVEGSEWLTPTARIGFYERALAIDPTWPEAHSLMGTAYLQRAYARFTDNMPVEAERDLIGAIAAYDRVIELEPKNEIAYAIRAYALLMHGEPARALADYRQAAKLGDANESQLEGRLGLALAERRFADVERFATRIVETEPEETPFFNRAVARFALGDIDGALADAERTSSLARRAYDEWAVAIKAAALLAKGDTRGAGETLVLAIAEHEGAPHLLPLLAYLAAKGGDLERAEALAARSRRQHDAFAKAYLALDPLWSSLAFAPAPYDEIGRALLLEVDLAAVAASCDPRAAAERAEAAELFARGAFREALAVASLRLATDPSDGAARLLEASCQTALGAQPPTAKEVDIIERLMPNRREEVDALRARADRRR